MNEEARGIKRSAKEEKARDVWINAKWKEIEACKETKKAWLAYLKVRDAVKDETV